MAYNIIRPRRGIKSMWDQFKGRIYKQGEMLVESPDTGVGTGPVNVKFGDGVTAYEHLPYAIEAPTSELTEGGTAPMTAGAGFMMKKDIKELKDGHDQSASTITAGTFKGDVVAAASANFSVPHVSNIVLVDTKPTVGANAPYPIGTYIRVKK